VAYDRAVNRAVQIDPDEFVRRVAPTLEKRDAHGLATVVRRNWSLVQVAGLLDGSHTDARKVAALALSLIGTDSCLDALARQLRHPDPVVAQMAEHAMWSIWFRGGTAEANAHLARGANLFAKQDVDGAVASFTKAIEAAPRFAEAYNQRAMALYLQERIEESLADCRRAVELMPVHFGAWAGMGHCHACLGERAEAVECYRQAKRINPHLACVDDLIEELSHPVEVDDAGGED